MTGAATEKARLPRFSLILFWEHKAAVIVSEVGLMCTNWWQKWDKSAYIILVSEVGLMFTYCGRSGINVHRLAGKWD